MISGRSISACSCRGRWSAVLGWSSRWRPAAHLGRAGSAYHRVTRRLFRRRSVCHGDPRFLLKRFFAQRLLGLAIVVTLGFTIGVLVAGPIYADAAREAILSSAVSHGAGHGEERPVPHLRRSRRTTTRPRTRPLRGRGLAAPGRQDRAAGSRHRSAGRRPIRTPRSRSRCCSATAPTDHLPYRGEPPQGPGEIALPGGIARLLGVDVGETVTAIGPTGEQAELTLVGRFDPPNRDDPFWFGDQTPFPPPDSTELSPALMDQAGYLEVMPALGVTSEYVWDVFLDLVGVPVRPGGADPARRSNGSRTSSARRPSSPSSR